MATVRVTVDLLSVDYLFFFELSAAFDKLSLDMLFFHHLENLVDLTNVASCFQSVLYGRQFVAWCSSCLRSLTCCCSSCT